MVVFLCSNCNKLVRKRKNIFLVPQDQNPCDVVVELCEVCREECGEPISMDKEGVINYGVCCGRIS